MYQRANNNLLSTVFAIAVSIILCGKTMQCIDGENGNSSSSSSSSSSGNNSTLLPSKNNRTSFDGNVNAVNSVNTTEITPENQTNISIDNDNNNNNQPYQPDDALNICNQTFSIPRAYLIELNITGTVPDEIDETSMCFVRCYMNKIGVLKNDIIDRERANELKWPRHEELLDDCSKESRDEKSACQRAYFLMRCVTINNLIYDDNNK